MPFVVTKYSIVHMDHVPPQAVACYFDVLVDTFEPKLVATHKTILKYTYTNIQIHYTYNDGRLYRNEHEARVHIKRTYIHNTVSKMTTEHISVGTSLKNYSPFRSIPL